MATKKATLTLGNIAGICCDELHVVYRTRRRPIEATGYFGEHEDFYTELASVELDGQILDENEQPVPITDAQEREILAAAVRKIEEWI